MRVLTRARPRIQLGALPEPPGDRRLAAFPPGEYIVRAHRGELSLGGAVVQVKEGETALATLEADPPR